MNEFPVTTVMVTFFGALISVLLLVIGWGISSFKRDMMDIFNSHLKEFRGLKRDHDHTKETQSWLIGVLSGRDLIDTGERPRYRGPEESSNDSIPERRLHPRRGGA